MSRCRLALVLGCACLMTFTMTGCSDAWNAGPLQYVENEALTNKEIKGKPNLSTASRCCKDKVRKALAGLFGDSPQHIKVPEGSGLTAGGLYLANIVQEGEGADAKFYPIYQDTGIQSPRKVAVNDVGDSPPQTAAMRSTAKTACIATASRVPATGRRPRSCIPFRAIIARESSSLPRLPVASPRTAMICAAPSRTGFMAHRCRRSMPS